MGANVGEGMTQDGGNNNYEGYFRAANNYGKLCNREESQNVVSHVSGRGVAGADHGGNRAVREQGAVWFGSEGGSVQNGPRQSRQGESMQGESRQGESVQGQNVQGQSRPAPSWASPPWERSPSWAMQNGGGSYWRPRGSPHNNRLGRRPWSEAPGAQSQHWTGNNLWRNHHTRGYQREQPAQGALAPDGNYLENYFSSYGNGYAEEGIGGGSGSGSCGYHYGGAPEQAPERESARLYNVGRGFSNMGGTPHTVRSSGSRRATLPRPRPAYAQPRALYHNGFPQMGSTSDDNQDMEDPYQGSTNVAENENRTDGSHWVSHTMDNSYEGRNVPHGEMPLMRGSYNFRKGNNGVGFPSTNSFVAPPHSNSAGRGASHWKKSTGELYGQGHSSFKHRGGKKRQKMDPPFKGESEGVETNPKKRSKTDGGDDDDDDDGDDDGDDDDDDDGDDDGDEVAPEGTNAHMKRSKQNGKFIFCHHCDVNVEAEKLEEHNQSEHIKCPIDNCGQIYNIDDLDVHLLNHIKNDKDEVILSDSKEIEKWIQERKKNYPTREKIADSLKNNENGKKKKKKKPNCLIEELLFESYCSAVGRNIYFKSKWEKSIFIPLLTKMEQNNFHNIYEKSYYPLFNNSMGKFFPTKQQRRPFKERQGIDSLNIHRKPPLLYQLMKKEIYLYEKRLIKCIEFITRSGFFDDSEGGAAGTDILELG
ncbi:unnamed protein product [Plasmodium vivax]|uniref:(malaria parasite P. vivax) hypothetical protein n=1 Tax=Plasmodium vivax TaxID=5855 RepID=A0A8S4H3D8_PLAVI|nr:unnamed protein product [Plasmodium vivax]